jgi:toxin ParE1/3/4
LLQVDASFSDLARHPKMGVAVTLIRRELTGMRKWPVKGFEKFLIFYVARPRGVTIVRILHAAQDWWNLLGIL